MADITNEQLTEAVRVLTETLGQRRADIRRLQDEVSRGEHELRLLADLLRLRGAALESDGVLLRHPTVVPLPTASTELAAAVIEILREAEKPLHVQELMGRLRDGGVQIPGKGEPANLIAHIRGKAEIVRPSRGVYALREWGLSDYTETRKTGKTKTTRGRTTTKRPRRAQASSVRHRPAAGEH